LPSASKSLQIDDVFGRRKKSGLGLPPKQEFRSECCLVGTLCLQLADFVKEMAEFPRTVWLWWLFNIGETFQKL
jgi:hypothetical protein